MVEFSLSLVPVAKGRPRMAVVKGKPIVYTPSKTRGFEAKVAAMAQQHFKQPLKGPISVSLTFLLPRPKTLMRRKDPDGEIPHISRPDLENLEKSILDGLNGIAFLDDRQVYRKHSEKMYHDKEGSPKIIVKVEAEM